MAQTMFSQRNAAILLILIQYGWIYIRSLSTRPRKDRERESGRERKRNWSAKQQYSIIVKLLWERSGKANFQQQISWIGPLLLCCRETVYALHGLIFFDSPCPSHSALPSSQSAWYFSIFQNRRLTWFITDLFYGSQHKGGCRRKKVAGKIRDWKAIKLKNLRHEKWHRIKSNSFYIYEYRWNNRKSSQKFLPTSRWLSALPPRLRCQPQLHRWKMSLIVLGTSWNIFLMLSTEHIISSV